MLQIRVEHDRRKRKLMAQDDEISQRIKAMSPADQSVFRIRVAAIPRDRDIQELWIKPWV